MKMNLKPLGDRVVIEPIEQAAQLSVLLPQRVQDRLHAPPPSGERMLRARHRQVPKRRQAVAGSAGTSMAGSIFRFLDRYCPVIDCFDLSTFIDELHATRLENCANDFVNTFSRCHCHSGHCHTPAPHTARKTRIGPVARLLSLGERRSISDPAGCISTGPSWLSPLFITAPR